ncbi:MAG: FkbM family methyltransferase [Rickettsiaceae bacterium]
MLDINLQKSALEAKSILGRIPIYYDIGVRGGLINVWDELAKKNLIEAYGFDPAIDHISSIAKRDKHVKYLPVALGEFNEKKRLIHTFLPACSSFLEPNFELLQHYPARKIFEIVGESEVEVKTLDSLVDNKDIPAPDIIKLDTQGFELSILKGGISTLKNIVCIEIEVQFKPMYIGQSLFFETKEFLEDNGFILRDLKVNGPYEGEFLEADAFFSRKPALDKNIGMIRMWQEACKVDSPDFLAQDEYPQEWKDYITQEHLEINKRLFGTLK